MLGWELPPYHSGGLGIACEGMTKGLARNGMAISFVLPKTFRGARYDWMRVHDASTHALGVHHTSALPEENCLHFVMNRQCSLTRGYFANSTSETICYACFGDNIIHLPQRHEFAHVDLYAKGVLGVARKETFQAIHAHDWMTFPAAILARATARSRGLSAPFIAHVHATEIDRHDGRHIYNIEKKGLQAADRIIAVSNFTKNTISEHYGIDPAKISVVHNGIDHRHIPLYPRHRLKRRFKLVLFLGRITYQKGPDYFVRLAKRVTEQYKNVKFLMVGSGDMQASMIELAAREGLTGKLLFSSWARADQTDLAYQMADVFVMPSISEPFGIVPLEAIQNGTPAVVSKNSGFVEVVKNCIAVDFWDIEKTAKAIATLLAHEPYAKAMVRKAQEEVRHLTWDLAANKLIGVYGDTLRTAAYA